MESMQIRTHGREEMVDITRSVQNLIQEMNWQSGAILLYCPHTTGAVTIKMGDMQYPEGE